jgi:ribosomal-protein-alanine N-acetyltransferase
VIHLRKLAVQDVDHVLALARELTEMPQWPRDEFCRLATSCAQDRLYRPARVAISGKLLVGFAVASFLPSGDAAELETIVVRASHRRMGVGSQLLEILIREAEGRGADCMYLEVRPSNRAAISFYTKHGFSELGRRSDYYREPLEDALRLEVRLDKFRTGKSLDDPAR